MLQLNNLLSDCKAWHYLMVKLCGPLPSSWTDSQQGCTFSDGVSEMYCLSIPAGTLLSVGVLLCDPKTSSSNSLEIRPLLSLDFSS